MKLGELGTQLEEAIKSTVPVEAPVLVLSAKTDPGEALLERLQRTLGGFVIAGPNSEASPRLVQALRIVTDRFVAESATEPDEVHTGLRRAVRKVLYAAEAPITTVGDFIRSVQTCLRIDHIAFLQQFTRDADGIIDSFGGGLDFEKALGKLKAEADLAATFFNPQFGIDYDLFTLLGMDDRPLTIAEAQDVLEEAVLSRAKGLKAVTVGTINPKIIDDFAARLLALLKTVFHPQSGNVGTA